MPSNWTDKALRKLDALCAGGTMKKQQIALLVLLSLSPSGCNQQPANPAVSTAIRTQTVGKYTFVYEGDLTDGTDYQRQVWTIKDTNGTEWIAVRGYGVSESVRQTVMVGKTPVQKRSEP